MDCLDLECLALLDETGRCGGCGAAYDISTGGIAVPLGDTGLAIDTADGALAEDIGGIAIDL
jgi:hypothetical protein